MAKQPILVLVDGSAVFHRGYHAIPPTLTNKAGEPTNAIYGFTTTLMKTLTDLNPTYAVVAWDKSSKTFRNELYPQYKAHRPPTPDDLRVQFPLVKPMTEALGLSFVELDNYEADDIIGTFAAQAKGVQVVIVTGDKDQLQLINEHTVVDLYRPVGSAMARYDLAALHDRYGLDPVQFVDMKALMGDPSDNIPGVPGVGEKTAMTLLHQYGSLDEIYNNLGDLKGKLLERLTDNKELAYLSKKLSIIERNAPVTLDLESARLGSAKRDEVVALFHELDFRSLIAKLPAALHSDESATAKSNGSPAVGGVPSLFDTDAAPKREREHLKHVTYRGVTTKSELDLMIKRLEQAEVFAFDTETDSVNTMAANLVGLSFSDKQGEAWYVPVGHDKGQQLDRDETLAKLKPLLENPEIGKVGHNLKFDYEILKRYDITLGKIVWDTMVAAFLINPTARTQSLDDLAYGELDVEMIPISELIGVGKQQVTFATVPIEEAVTYAGEDADMAWRIYQKQIPEMKKFELNKLADETEWPLIPVLGDMEIAGIELDTKFLEAFNKVISKQILELEEKICDLAGERFNINSPSQLSEILYNKLGLTAQGIKKGKTGMSTAANELEKLRGQHEIIDFLFEYRELVKLKSTYVDALPQLVAADGRIHTSFNQTIAQTGRLSSTNPNLQNIPVRTELGREIRKAFVAPKGRVFVSADYSQIDLRVAAALSKDPAMIKTFNEGVDLHQQTAAELYDIPLEEVTKDQRSAAKTINFDRHAPR
jgi:DNA polymerase-1